MQKNTEKYYISAFKILGLLGGGAFWAQRLFFLFPSKIGNFVAASAADTQEVSPELQTDLADILRDEYSRILQFSRKWHNKNLKNAP